MAKMKELVLQVRYPYAAGVIAAIWIGTALLVAVNNSLPLAQLIIANSVASIIIAVVGFSPPKR
jgi:hypothetical protein